MVTLKESAGVPLVGMGCMRLSTDPERDEVRAIGVLHAAFDAGVNFLDTADAYCHDHHDVGHNERLIARALASWSGNRSRIFVATKGGLTRPQGNWVPDGRARHLVKACEASRQALGVERIFLYQLHVPDPRTALATSVRALASLQEEGRIEHIGLCNVTVGQIEESRGIADIAAVQVELGAWHDDNVLSGVVEYCLSKNILVLAHRPLGGPQRRRRTAMDRALTELAARHTATPFEIVLAWLTDLSPLIVPIPGPTRIETAQSLARGRTIVFTEDDRALLDERFPTIAAVRRRNVQSAPVQKRAEGEVVLIMGVPAAGKSTLARTLAGNGYQRLNRDEAGGSLRELVLALDALIESGTSRIVIDNTYVSRKSRALVMQAAAKRGLDVRCLWVSASVENAQVNAVSRILSRYHRLLEPEELKAAAKQDPAAFGPMVQFRYQRDLEPPHDSEGFSQIEIVPFERTRDSSFTNKAVILWCDDVIWRSRSGHRTPSSPEDVDVFAERIPVLRRYRDRGWRLLGLGWQPEIAEEKQTRAQVEAGFARMRDLLDLDIEVEYCPHGAGPPTCWCRKPLPGLGVVFIERYRLDPSQCIYVGNGPQDPGFARRLGFQYREASEFFS